MGKTRLLVVAACAAAVVGVGASAAFAGEVNGSATNPKDDFSQGASYCKYSGLNDDPSAAPPEGGKVQSYGQLRRNGGDPSSLDFPLNLPPGVGCNPTKSPLPPLK